MSTNARLDIGQMELVLVLSQWILCGIDTQEGKSDRWVIQYNNAGDLIDLLSS